MDQSKHIQTKALHEYFKDTPSSSISKKLYQFPTEASFGKLVFDAPPLPSFKLHQRKKSLSFSFNSTTGAFMYTTTICCPDLASLCPYETLWLHVMPKSSYIYSPPSHNVLYLLPSSPTNHVPIQTIQVWWQCPINLLG